MSLSQAITASVSGLKANQAALDLASRNIANASTTGYTRKSLAQSNLLVGGEGIGVSAQAAIREVDKYLQAELRRTSASAANADIKVQFLERVNDLYGTPDSEGSIAGYLSRLETAFQELTTSPESTTSREILVSRAQELASELNRMSDEIQSLRREAEAKLEESVAEVNSALALVHDLNLKISANQSGSTADLEDQRDVAIAEIAARMDITVSQRDNGTVSIFTKSGNLLLDTEPAVLSFDEHPTLNATSLYSSDSSLRGVGTITLQMGNATPIDLIATNAIRDGELAGLIEMRDTTLVEAQAQLDEIAHNLARTLSDTTVTSSAVTGPPDGYDIDVSGVNAGDQINLTYTDTGSSTQYNVSIIRVDDAATLPLSNTDTSNPNDIVIGVEWGGSASTFAANIDAALAAAGIAVDASNPSGTTVRLVDDGGAGTTDVDEVTATVTTTSLTDNGTSLALFVDGEAEQIAYTSSLDGIDQKVGFAGRIAVNSSIVADSSYLVVYETTPNTTDAGDPSRPNALLSRLVDAERYYDATSTGIGGTAQPFAGSILDFTERTISYQTSALNEAERLRESQQVVLTGLQEKYTSDTAVDIDTEMAQLLVLQNAYAANARVLTVVQELMDTLIAIVR